MKRQPRKRQPKGSLTAGEKLFVLKTLAALHRPGTCIFLLSHDVPQDFTAREFAEHGLRCIVCQRRAHATDHVEVLTRRAAAS